MLCTIITLFNAMTFVCSHWKSRAREEATAERRLERRVFIAFLTRGVNKEKGENGGETDVVKDGDAW